MDKSLVLKPRISEKTYGLGEMHRTYVFDVPTSANKHAVARAVAAQFEVAIANVNMAVVKGKPKRTIRKNSRPVQGKRSDVKKAYVTLKEGSSLPFFEEKDDSKKNKTGKAHSSRNALKEKKS